MPHDYRFPFAVVYQESEKVTKLSVMVLWAHTEKIRKQWLEAFKYIVMEESPLLIKDVPIPQ